MQKTICCKLITHDEVEKLLEETSQTFADACNFALQEAIVTKTSNPVKLHKLCYSKIRQQFVLSANLSVRVIRRVCGNLTRLKKKRKHPKKYQAKSIDYDARIFYYMEKELFKCLTCGEMDADINAAIVISKGGVVCKPARISSVS